VKVLVAGGHAYPSDEEGIVTLLTLRCHRGVDVVMEKSWAMRVGWVVQYLTLPYDAMHECKIAPLGRIVGCD
jgi:hypothetical protein